VREHGIAWDSELCVLAAAGREELLAKARALLERLESAPEGENLGLADIAYSLAKALDPAAGGAGHVRLAIVASSVDDLVAKLKRATDRLANPDCKQIRETAGIYYTAEPLAPQGKVAFLFPGEGSPYVNMLADLCVVFPSVREVFEEADRLHREQGKDFVPSDFIFPRASTAEERSWAQAQLQTLEGAISSVLTADTALFRVLEGLGVKPDAVVGHSAGEQAALLAAGVYGSSIEGMSNALLEIETGQDLRKDIPASVMLALGTDKADVEALIREHGLSAEVAIDNCPHQVIVVLSEESEAAFAQAASSRGIIAERMSFDRPYHTAAFAPFSKRLRQVLDGVALHAPCVPLYSCMTAARFASDERALADVIAGQWSSPVEFRKTIERMHADGIRLFVEVGPRNNLTAFVEDCLRGKDHCAVAANNHQRAGITQINHMAGLLLVQGVPVRLDYLHEHRPAKLISLDPNDPAAKAGPAATGSMALATAAPEMRLPPDFALSHRAVSWGTASGPSFEDLRMSEGQHDGGTLQPQNSPEHSAHDAAAPAAMMPASVPAPEGVAGLPGVAMQSGDLAAIAHGFLQTMDRFLQVQNQVMQAYFQATSGVASGEGVPSLMSPAPVVPYVSSMPAQPAAPANGAVAQPAQPPAASAGVATAAEPAVRAPEAVAATPEQLKAPALSMAESLPMLLKQIVSDRTGYPLEIIDLHADLEADLGIDSIKRVEILGTLRQSAPGVEEINLELLTPQRSLQQIVDVIVEALGAPAAGAAADAEEASEASALVPEAPSLWGTVVRHAPGEEIVVERSFDPNEDGWLRDHVLGREVSASDPDLLGLPVLPLALAIELMAQAAAALKPGNVVVRIEAARANRWVAFEHGPQTVQVRAHALEQDGSRVWVELRNLSEEAAAGSPMSPASEATVILAPGFPKAPAPMTLENTDGKPRLQAGRYYDDLLFHGPSWQVLREVEACGSGGARATVAAPGPEPFAGLGAISWVLDPVALDGGAQVMGCWALENLSEGTAMLPLSVESIELFGPPPAATSELTCLLRPTGADPDLVTADFDMTLSGAVVMRVRGWAERRFYLPDPMKFLATPGALGNVAEPLSLAALPAELQASSEARSLAVQPVDNAAFMGRLWALRILSRRERERPDLRNGARSDIQRLAGMHVAKEAARVLVQRAAGLDVALADIELEPGGESGFRAKGAWSGDVGGEMTVWLAQVGSESVALATLEPASFYEPLAFVRGLIGRESRESA
jgi:malonyl CoA-acyl carrier protein transacylase/acyl carrier protein